MTFSNEKPRYAGLGWMVGFGRTYQGLAMEYLLVLCAILLGGIAAGVIRIGSLLQRIIELLERR